MLAALLLSACQPPAANEPVLLVVSASDDALLLRKGEVEAPLEEAAKGLLTLVPKEVAARALSSEGGADKREANLVKARVLLNRAEERFRELDAEEALGLIAKATANLAPVHQEEGAIGLLSRAHLLAGAIYLARDRVEAAKNRLQRALDLDPDISPPRHRFAPRVLAELASLRSAQNVRPVGRLEVRLGNEGVSGQVFVDGQRRGQTPLVLDALGEGRHLLRVSAPGFRSYVASISIARARGHVEVVNLVPDAEVSQIVALPRMLRRGDDLAETLELLARRADAERAVLAALVLSEARTVTGAPALGVRIVVPGAGEAYAPSPDQLRPALERALSCATSGPTPSPEAPTILGLGAVEASRPRPVPEPASWWDRPWFWGTAAVVTLAIAGGFVVARASGGPPESVEVTLIPRP